MNNKEKELKEKINVALEQLHDITILKCVYQIIYFYLF